MDQCLRFRKDLTNEQLIAWLKAKFNEGDLELKEELVQTLKGIVILGQESLR